MSISRTLSTLGDRMLGRLLPDIEASAQRIEICGPAGGALNGQTFTVWCCYYPDGHSSCW
ncbi:hypothetical protein [Kitasatospora cathayae]|uniref:Uncharacterized protein n=1 Tax=Kitasatospora cathayae TaxID=3004092 RepID=A0ABY7QFB5_9ACTN|nr:hypothetical protein [Kitasatospora sp. HUAS 3-15]WBP91400.1 hypothetical protein O1G21_39665 [Kitasatospora sp. HUAS 3-15]